MAITTLSDVPVLAPLVDVAQTCGVSLRLFGSVASRVALKDAFGTLEHADLFTLAEHGSDIDIAHSGPSAQTAAIRLALEGEVPLADWFRWSVIDRDEWARLETQKKYNPEIPLRRIEIGTDAGPDDEMAQSALRDALEGLARFSRNLNFAQSPRATENFDTEAAGVLLLIDAIEDLLAEGRAAEKFNEIKIDPGPCRECIDASVEQLRQWQPEQRAIACQRLWYRLSALGSRMSARRMKLAADYFGLQPLFDYLKETDYGTAVERLSHDPLALIAVSSALHQGFRIDPAPDAEVLVGGAASSAFENLLDVLGKRSTAPASKDTKASEEDEAFRLADGDRPLAAVRGLTLRPGIAPSADAARPLIQDFIHVSFSAHDQLLLELPICDTGLLAFARKGDDVGICPVAASVSRSLEPEANGAAQGRLTIRCNMLGLNDLETLDLFIVGRDTSRG